MFWLRRSRFRIEAPHFVAGCDDGACAPIIAYMRDWPIERVRSYCKTKGWRLEEYPKINDREHRPSDFSFTDQGAQMNDYSNIFSGIAKSKSMGGGYAQRLGMGHHRLAIKSYKVKDSTKGTGQFIEAEFVVVQSTTHEQGETRGWVWFINAQGQWGAAYEQDRAKKFLEAVGACVGDDSPVDVIGANLAGPDQAGRGLIIEVDITPQGGKNAGKLNQRGEPYTNSFWKPVTQSIDDIAASRAELDSLEPKTPVQTTQTPAPKGLGLLGKRG